MSSLDRKHLPTLFILPAPSSHVTRRQPARPRSHRDYNPQKAPRRRGAESRPGSSPTGTSGRDRGSRRRRKRRATVLPVTPCPCLSFPPHPKLGLLGSTSPLTPGTRLPFCFVSGIFFPSRDARGGPPPGAEVTGKLPPFDPCGAWIVGDPPEALLPSQGLRTCCGPSLQIHPAKGTFFLRVSTGTERVRGDPGVRDWEPPRPS